LKKIAPIFLIFFLLTGCKIKDYTPEIPTKLDCFATVVSGDFSYECEICRDESSVSVTILSTYAKGMKMSFDSKSLTFSFDDMEYEIGAENFEKTNPAIVIYEVLESVENSQSDSAVKTDDGFRYEGKTSLGNFIFLQNDDNSFNSITFRGLDYSITFHKN
jgi:hypothetical protein